MEYNEELEKDAIILHHSDIPSDLWVIATKRMLSNLKDAKGGYPLSVDPTFNHGMFEVTAMTYRHRLIESKSKDNEIEKALYGSSNQYRLIKEAEYLQVSMEEWFQLTRFQKEKYLSAIHDLTLKDVNNRKAIYLPEPDNMTDFNRTPLQSLSMKLSDV